MTDSTRIASSAVVSRPLEGDVLVRERTGGADLARLALDLVRRVADRSSAGWVQDPRSARLGVSGAPGTVVAVRNAPPTLVTALRLSGLRQVIQVEPPAAPAAPVVT